MRGRAPKHLLVMRLSAMGDVAMSVHALKSLREENPDVRITIFTRPLFKSFFRDIEGVEFVELDIKEKHKTTIGLIKLSLLFIRMGVTHVADLHDVIRTKMIRKILWLSGRKCRTINKDRDAKKQLTRRYHKVMNPLKPTVLRYQDVFKELGFKVGSMNLEQKERPIPQFITDNVGDKRGTWIGVAPFAQHKGKIYPSKHIDKLVELLEQEYDRIFLFGGGAYEKEFSEFIEQKYSKAISTVGKMNIGQELDLMANIDTMITMDSASMHMASLVGTRVVSIWGATHPYAGFLGYGQRESDVVSVNMECRPCSVYGNKPCVFGDYRCMEAVTPEMVVDAVAKSV